MDNTEILHVGRPNIGDRNMFIARVNEIIDRRWLSNNGPVVKEFEQKVADILGVKHVITTCNATAALEISCRALGLKGEVIIPSYTFVATAHALQWQGITPVFCDIDPVTHNIDPNMIEGLITPRTTGIVGVHLWGRGCETLQIEQIAGKHNLKVLYDSSHAFGCTKNGQMIGGFGECEIFSFHATKFINTLEGGIVSTNDDELASRMRRMINFGFTDFDQVDLLGINGKMNEISAAMGLTNIESMAEIIETNKSNYDSYLKELDALPGIYLIRYDPDELGNYQYVVVEIDLDKSKSRRDTIVNALHNENIMARKYFWPGCHKMEPYKSLDPNAGIRLPETERIAERVMILPTGQSINHEKIERICSIVRRVA